jgi:crotonobetainyl-CoA:carnitine CoA-transferase CaiB-like acyl-CoA transferase
MKAGALEGVRVIDFGHMLAGPYCTTLLGDMGADVIKIERPGRGDGMRYTDADYPGGISSYYLGINRNKRAATVDITQPAGRDVVLDLIRSSHVVVENFRPGKMDKLGLGFDAAIAVNPSIVYCSITSFGPDGPLATKPGMDLVIQAMSGVMGHTGLPGIPPVRLAPSLADFTGAMFATYGILAALRVAEQKGTGQRVEVSLLEGQIAFLSNYIPHFFATGEPSGPVGGAHPQLVPYQVFEAADGYFVVACLTNRFWCELCTAIGLEDLAENERFRTNADRLRNRDVLIPILSDFFRTKAVAHWTTLLDSTDVPNAPILMLKSVVEHPQTLHMKSIDRIHHPVAGEVPIATNPARLSKTPARLNRPAPDLSEHTDEVLAELGYTVEWVRELRDHKTI